MNPPARILLVAGIVAALVFLATRPQEPPASLPAPEARAEVVEPRCEAEVLAPAAERTAVPAEEDAGWRVRVLDGITHAVVAGATVRVVDFRAEGRELSARGIGRDTLAGRQVSRELSVEERTGADGCARFPSIPEHALVEARLEANWAFAVVNQEPPGRCVTLELAPDHALPVRVVDTAGTPVGGVPVALRRQRDPGQASDFKWTDTEAGTGVATFLHFQRRLAQGTGWHALLAFPVPAQIALPVDADTPCEPPPTLVLPGTGRMRFRVRGTDGGLPDLEGIELHLEAFEHGVRLWPDLPWARPHLSAEGEALVPWIGLGLQIEAVLVEEGDELVVRRLAGPASAGEELLCELVLPRQALSSVTGRFVLREGRAWPAATVKVQAELFPTPSRWPPQREVAVERGGRFRMSIRDPRPADGTRSFRFSAPHPDGPGEVSALVPLDQDVPPAGLDLGDVLLDYGELLVSGRVVDAERRPITGADVTAHSRTLVSEAEFWPHIRTAGTSRTAADGEFALYLPPGERQPGEALRLSTRAAGFVDEDQREIRRGERNVEVVLAQAGALAGSLALCEGLVPDDVALFLSSDEAQFVPLGSDSTFEVPGLLPGTYSLAVRRHGVNGRFEREPAALVEGLLVLAGETCRDPRIQGLRIASLVPSLRIRVVDRASTPLRGAAVSVAGLADARPALSGSDGVCFVHSEVLPIDLEVSAFGYLRQRLASVGADREVVLEAGIPIRLRTSARPSGGEPRFQLGAMLHSVDANGARRGLAWGAEYSADYSSDRTHFDARGELALRMPAPGVYECNVTVTVLSGSVGRGGSVALDPAPRITVHASDVEQLFELVIPQDAVEAAIARALR